jgi:hypothetical protein
MSWAVIDRRLASIEAVASAKLAPVSLVWPTPVELAQAAGIEPDDWQADVMRSISDRIILNCSRQSGKSLTVATIAVHTALTEPGALVLLISPTLRQSGEIFRKCKALWTAAGAPIGAKEETQLTLTLANGSRLVSLPGQDPGAVRGYSGPALIAVDEAAWVRDELIVSLFPMLAVSQGRLITLSTPFATRGWYFETFTHGGAVWERYTVPAVMCPRISAEFLAAQRKELGDFWYQSEYECRFLDAQSQAFRREDIDRMYVEQVQPWAL